MGMLNSTLDLFRCMMFKRRTSMEHLFAQAEVNTRLPSVFPAVLLVIWQSSHCAGSSTKTQEIHTGLQRRLSLIESLISSLWTRRKNYILFIRCCNSSDSRKEKSRKKDKLLYDIIAIHNVCRCKYICGMASPALHLKIILNLKQNDFG